MNSPLGRLALWGHGITCANPACGQLTLTCSLERHEQDNGNVRDASFIEDIKRWDLLPDGAAKPWPDYIPAALLEDYREACSIASRSPKAAATLARRCVQGAIRNFCGINERTLDLEIKALKKAVEAHAVKPVVTIETVQAINDVREVGNIGAHMEQDVNVIIPVDQDEADTLIQLIEMLFREWYVADHDRKERLGRLTEMAATKKAAKSEAKAKG